MYKRQRPEATVSPEADVAEDVVELQLTCGPEAGDVEDLTVEKRPLGSRSPACLETEATEAMSLGFIFGCHDAGALLS